MNKNFSDKIRVLSFLSILLVVIIHCYNIKINFLGNSNNIAIIYIMLIEEFFSHSIGLLAVPVFFLVSGYHFFINYENKYNKILLKFRKRFKSLVIPYLFWVISNLIFVYLMQQIPLFEDFFANKKVIDFSFDDYIYKLFIMPQAYQFWFIRDLIIFILLSPAIYQVLRLGKKHALIVLFVLWLIGFSLPLINFEGLLFFIIGCYWGIIKKENFPEYSNQIMLLITILFLFSSLIWAFHLVYDMQIDLRLINTLRKIVILVGVIWIWFFVGSLAKSKIFKIILKLSKYTFFIFAIHEPLLIILKKLLLFSFGNKEIFLLISYFVYPILIVFIALAIAKLMHMRFYRFYTLITGGR